MSHLSRHRTKLIAGAVIAASGTVASASPLLNFAMYGHDVTTSGPVNPNGPTGVVPQPYTGAGPNLAGFTQNLSVNVGDTVVYAILTFLAPVGTTNSSSGGHTINTIGSPESGLDGLGVANFDAYQLASDSVQVDFKNAHLSSMQIPGNEAVGLFTYADTMNWHGATGATGGNLGTEQNVPGHRTGPNNDILFIRPGATAGNFFGESSSTPESVIGTGFFVVASGGGTSPVRMRYTPTAEGGGGDAFQINDGANPTKDTITATDATELGADPLVAYSQLTINAPAVPEPGSLSLLGLAAAGLLVRRKNKNA